ncbi:MAG: response regulator [Bacteroidales bacterium]|jgi:DNA-binding NtrC family response regulator|nr:response regulator [Bacteroidales bacterium]
MLGILIVDNDNELREMIGAALVVRRFAVMEAKNGREAIANFKPLVIDAVITDIIMPEADGLEVIMKLKKLKPELKIIAMSGGGKVSPHTYLELAKKFGADVTLTKPFMTDSLVSTVERLLGTGKYRKTPQTV